MVVLGFPRSGTTAASELAALSTGGFFDRDNVFPVSGENVWHTHRRLSKVHRRHMYMIRDPVDVATSGYFYLENLDRGDLTSVLRGSRLLRGCSWERHVDSALRADCNVFFYDELIECTADFVSRFSAIMETPPEVIAGAISFMRLRRRHRHHSSDLPDARSQVEYEEIRRAAAETFQHEKSIYQDLTRTARS